MNFIASLTRDSGELNTMFRLWQEHGDERDPFANVMITPLFMPPNGKKVIQNWREKGIIKNLYFDSAGFYVQMGKIEYTRLFSELLKVYRNEQWADWYILPDHVPTSGDAEETIWKKVRDTAEYSQMFYEELPSELQMKSIPVVHGFTAAQANYSLQAAIKLKTGYIGFGSFSTSGKSSSINKLTPAAYTLLSQITNKIAQASIKLHAFGVSTPPVVHLLRQLKVFSFDSIGWMKTAGFGKVYMPYVRAYNITYKDKSAQTITRYEFEEMQAITGHTCFFCSSFQQLHEKRYYRIMHNLSVMMDMMHKVYTPDHIHLILDRYSAKYNFINGEIK
jgi:hypothetical protein